MVEKVTLWNDQSREDFIQHLRGVNVEKRWTVTLEQEKNKRTLSQNALMHKWFEIIAKDVGETQAEIKEIYRHKFLLPVVVELGGETYEVRKSTTKLTKEEMGIFMTAIYSHATQELGIMLPVPEENHMSGKRE